MTQKNTTYKSQGAEFISDISFEDMILILKKWINYLLTKWIVIFFIGVLGGLFGVIYAWQKPITYNAKLTFVVEEGKSASTGLGGLSSLAGQFGIDLGGGQWGGAIVGR
ncbi:MAG: hypothetical protein WAZ36_08000 [Sediminibacterium sp.]